MTEAAEKTRSVDTWPTAAYHATARKLTKPKTETHQVGGDTFAFVEVDVIRGVNAHEAGKPVERDRYEVRMNGVLVGYAHRPHGIGKKPFRASALWRRAGGALGNPDLSGFGPHLNQLRDLATVAAAFAVWTREGRAMSLEQAEALQASYDASEAAREASTRFAMAMRAKTAAAETDQHRQSVSRTLEGLRSIKSRLSARLSNAETEALRQAISRLEDDLSEGDGG